MGAGRTKTFDTESYRILAELSQAIIFEWEVADDYIQVSDNWKTVFGKKPSGRNFSGNTERIFCVPPEKANLLAEYVGHIRGNGTAARQHYEKFELHLLTKNDEYVWFQVRLLLRCDADDKPERVFGMMTDIDVQKKEYENLLREAQHDVLTGLYNKATTQNLIADYLENIGPKEMKQALFIIDIDSFKAINDHFGHLFGDAVIVDIAQCIQNAFKKTDIVGRIGGDEFMALLKDGVEEEAVSQKARELVEVLPRKYMDGKKTYKISASVGVVISPDHGGHFEELFRKADKALYYTKANGKNGYCLYNKELSVPQYVSKRYFKTGKKEKKNHGAFYENVIECIFSILHRSTDANTATNLILEMIGRRYGISRTFIIERNSTGSYTDTFEWCNDEVEPQRSAPQNISAETAEKFLDCLDKNGVFCCSDTDLLPRDLKAHFAAGRIRAILECAIFSEGKIGGVIGFEHHSQPREWKSEEIEALSFTAEILGTFLLQKRSMDNVKYSHMQALEILDHIESFIYVIDENSHEVLFFNKSAAEFSGNDELEKVCCSIVGGGKTKSPHCPAQLTAGADSSAQGEVYLETCGVWLQVSVTKIHWAEDRDVCMVHCHDITSLKKKE